MSVKTGPQVNTMQHVNLPERQISAPPRRLSTVLREISGNGTGPVSVATVRDSLADRSFAALLVIFAAINLLPLPPGSSAILGLPLVLVSAQMIMGRKTAWLPGFVLKKKMGRERFSRNIGRLLPWLEWLERFVQPRYWPFPSSQNDRIIGSVALLLGLAVTIPIPFGNWPPAFACALIGLALSERDGVLLAIGITLGALSIAVIVAVVAVAGAAAGWVYQSAL